MLPTFLISNETFFWVQNHAKATNNFDLLVALTRNIA
jgi:hypothetical protein